MPTIALNDFWLEVQEQRIAEWKGPQDDLERVFQDRLEHGVSRRKEVGVLALGAWPRKSFM